MVPKNDLSHLVLVFHTRATPARTHTTAQTCVCVRTHTHTHTRAHTHSLSLSHTHTHITTLTCVRARTHTHSLFHSLTHTLSLAHTLSRTHNRIRPHAGNRQSDRKELFRTKFKAKLTEVRRKAWQEDPGMHLHGL